MSEFERDREVLNNGEHTRYILLPVYNEEENLAKVIASIYANCSDANTRIIAVNDGSGDSSLEILRQQLQAVDTLSSYRINMNIGAVFSEGINTFISKGKPGDIFIIIESDGTSDLGQLDTMVSSLRSGDNDIVIASRYKGTGRYIRFPLKRKILSVAANSLMKWRFPIKNVEDYTIFFRAYKFEVLEKMVAWYGRHGLIRSKGFSANAEILVKASFLGARIEEIPFQYDYGKKLGRSKLNIFSTVIEYFGMWGELSYVSRKLKNLQIDVN